MTSNDDYVLQLLQEQGYVSQGQVSAVMNSIKQEGETTLDILLQTGAVSEDTVLGMLAEQFGMVYVHVNAEAIAPEVAEIIPAAVARKYGVVPVEATDTSVTVALSDPLGYDTVDSLRLVLGRDVEAVVAPRSEVRAAVDKFYPEDFENIFGMDDPSIDVSEKEKVSEGSDSERDDAPVIRFVSRVITEASKMRASDIHLEPMERTFRIRYRIDGALQQMDSPSKRLQASILSRIKIMSNMKISEKRIPQDGRIQIKVQGRDLDLRV